MVAVTSLAARALRLVLGVSVSLVACLIPPDGPLQPPATGNFAPEILLATIDPATPVLEVSDPDLHPQDCRGFRVSAEVLDRNEQALKVRFVANNRVRNRARPMIDFDLPPSKLPQRRIGPVNPAADFDPPRTREPHIISMFVTDAPAWAVSSTAAATDFGLIDTDPDRDGVADFALVEYRWVVQFVPTGGRCP